MALGHCQGCTQLKKCPKTCIFHYCRALRGDSHTTRDKNLSKNLFLDYVRNCYFEPSSIDPSQSFCQKMSNSRRKWAPANMGVSKMKLADHMDLSKLFPLILGGFIYYRYLVTYLNNMCTKNRHMVLHYKKM